MNNNNTSLEETMGANYVYAEPESYVTEEKGLGGYKFLSVLFLVLAIGGLFIGMLSKSLPQLFSYHVYGHLFGDEGTKVFDACLLGTLIGLFANPSVFGAKFAYGGAGHLTEYVFNLTEITLVFCATLVAIVALALMFVALFSKKKSLVKNCAMASGILLFLIHFGIFMLVYVKEVAAVENFSMLVLEVPAGTIALLAFIALFVTALIRNKGVGFMNFVLLLLTVLAAFALSFSGSESAKYVNTAYEYFDLKNFGTLFFGISIAFFTLMLAINIFCTVIRMNAKRGYMFDLVRYSLQLLALILLIASSFCVGNTAWIFKGTSQIIGTVVLITVTILAFLLVLLYVVMMRKKKQVVVPVAESVPVAGYENNGYANVYANGYVPEEPAPVVIDPVYVAPEVIQQPVYYVDVEPEPVYAEPQRVIHEHVYQNVPQQPIIQQVPQEPQHVIHEQRVIHEHVYQNPPEPEPRVIEQHIYQEPEPKKDKPLTEFELRMQMLAQNKTQETKKASNATPPPPHMTRRERAEAKAEAKAQRKAQPTAHGNYNFNGYMYDPFIKTLTPEERNEFGDIFIANIYGLNNCLPTYVIGGDNMTFFNRVFIYMGMYRNYITQALLDKIYLYVSKL